MIRRDVAESPRASHRPDPADAIDTFPDLLREQIAAFTDPLPRTPAERVQQFFAILARALKIANVEECALLASQGSQLDVVVPVLRLIAEDLTDRQLAMKADALLKLLGRDHRSFQETAEFYGVSSRACPHQVYRKMQAKTGLRSRRDKSDASREACRQRRLGRRREAPEFRGAAAWAAAAARQLTLPVLAVASPS